MVGVEFLQKITTILRKSLSADETYSAIFNILDDVIEFDAATLFLLKNDGKKELTVVAQRGSSPVDILGEVGFKKGSGLSGWVANQDRPVIISAVGARGGSREFRSLLSLPLWSGGKTIGVLNLGHHEPAFYTEDKEQYYGHLATQISLIVDQLRLRSALQEKNTQLQQLLTDLKETQESLVEKERLAAIGQLVVTVNHEINNPLSIISTQATLLEEELSSQSREIIERVEHIQKAVKRIGEVTQALSKAQTLESEDYLEGVSMLKL